MRLACGRQLNCPSPFMTLIAAIQTSYQNLYEHFMRIHIKLRMQMSPYSRGCMNNEKEVNMAQSIMKRLCQPRFLRRVAIILATLVLGGLLVSCFADEPARDPAGIATGDKTSTYDAGGNAVRRARAIRSQCSGLRRQEEGVRRVPGPAGQRAAGGEAGRHVGHVRIATNFAWTLNHRLPGPVHAGRVRAADLRSGPQEERRPSDDAELRGLRVRLPRLLRRAATPSSSARSRSTRRRPTSAARRR